MSFNTDFQTYWGVPLEIKRVALLDTGDDDLIAAVSDKRLLVVFAHFSWYDATTTGAWKLQSGGTTDLTPAFQTLATGVHTVIWPFNPLGWVITVVSEKLNLDVTTLDSFASLIGYVEV